MNNIVASDTISSFISGLKEWQTLATGALGITVAFLTVVAMNRQTRVHERMEEKKRENLLRAKKSILSVALSDLYKSCLKSAKTLDHWSVSYDKIENLFELQLLNISEKSFDLISSIIENEDNSDINELLSHLIYKITSCNRTVDKLNDYLANGRQTDASNEVDEIAECLGAIAAISVKLIPYAYGKQNINTDYPTIWEICALFNDHELDNIDLEEHLTFLEKMTQHLLSHK